NDVALNQPGRITNVSTIYENYGSVRNESLDLGAEYFLPWQQLGDWRISFNAAHNLETTRELRPGVALIDDNGDTNSAPDWNFVTSVFWQKNQWSAAAFAYYTSGFNTNAGGNPWTNEPSIVSSVYPDMWRL